MGNTRDKKLYAAVAELLTVLDPFCADLMAADDASPEVMKWVSKLVDKHIPKLQTAIEKIRDTE